MTLLGILSDLFRGENVTSIWVIIRSPSPSTMKLEREDPQNIRKVRTMGTHGLERSFFRGYEWLWPIFWRPKTLHFSMGFGASWQVVTWNDSSHGVVTSRLKHPEKLTFSWVLWRGHDLKTLVIQYILSWQFFMTFLGWLSDPFKWLSDLQQGMKRSRLESPG